MSRPFVLVPSHVVASAPSTVSRWLLPFGFLSPNVRDFDPVTIWSFTSPRVVFRCFFFLASVLRRYHISFVYRPTYTGLHESVPLGCCCKRVLYFC
ncbi:hypothetical protein L226DRAFT_14669 [Lentinus tigrinus ALCF2SS1-7]|uniref:uncharacterized protein n=1 Tax=Lentinus tigrinus ALCF2SS1-7 TaxID=1328758 RepID=UPI00116607C0|nr:hypothetical protein L226DRAFT_14669 [Lentinus tigrinus ALCF2SS1-7]